MLDNAVAHYRHLREQGVRPVDAVEHARLRYGIPANVLRKRVNGLVADSEATQEALAAIREHRRSHMPPADEEGAHADYQDRSDVLLDDLYNAVTGEGI